jgi:acid phosphatase (class A)
MIGKFWILAGILSCGLDFGGSATAAETSPMGDLLQKDVTGYLQPSELVDNPALLPAPPALGSAAEALDEEIAKQALALQGSDRFKLATQDADLNFPAAAGTFSCSLNAPISAEDTPVTYRMLRRLMRDAGGATAATKNKYQHARPFMMDDQPTCQSSADESLRSNGSYPSGHTSIGWAWALALAEIAPDHAETILERGRAFGDSRIVCNVHWASDVTGGRTIASAIIARLHANAEFVADLKVARSEIDAATAKHLPPTRDCKFESQTLSKTPWLAP